MTKIRLNESKFKNLIGKMVNEALKRVANEKYGDATGALSTYDSLDSSNKHLEDWCEEQMRRYSGPEWGDYAIECITPVLKSAVDAANYGDSIEHINNRVKSQGTSENRAWHIAHAKFAMQLARRYGIDLSSEWNRIYESFRRRDKSYEDGTDSLYVSDDIDRANKVLERYCEECVKQYPVEEYGEEFVKDRLMRILLPTIKAAQNKGIPTTQQTKDIFTGATMKDINSITQSKVKNYAWRVAHARFAMRLAKRYGIDLYDNWSQVNEAKRNKTQYRDLWHGVEGAGFISHGEWSDPEVMYQGETINGTELENYAWSEYSLDCKDAGKEPDEEEFDNLPTSWFKRVIDDYSYGMFSDNY